MSTDKKPNDPIDALVEGFKRLGAYILAGTLVLYLVASDPSWTLLGAPVLVWWAVKLLRRADTRAKAVRMAKATVAFLVWLALLYVGSESPLHVAAFGLGLWSLAIYLALLWLISITPGGNGPAGGAGLSRYLN